MASITIKTNRNKRQFKYMNEVSSKILADDFEWLNKEDKFDGWIYYRRRWYHISEFVSPSSVGCPFDDGYWSGYISDSFFSGILLHIDDDNETYTIATYMS